MNNTTAALRARQHGEFGRANLFQMRAFYLAYREILQIASRESAPRLALQKVQTASGQFVGHKGLAAMAGSFPLPWSHYVRLLAVRNACSCPSLSTRVHRCPTTSPSFRQKREPFPLVPRGTLFVLSIRWLQVRVLNGPPKVDGGDRSKKNAPHERGSRSRWNRGDNFADTSSRSPDGRRPAVQKLLRANGLKPHLVRTYKVSRDPAFAVKVKDVVGLYLNPPENAIVLSVDEKTSIRRR